MTLSVEMPGDLVDQLRAPGRLWQTEAGKMWNV
jgi:hypothetical protein